MNKKILQMMRVEDKILKKIEKDLGIKLIDILKSVRLCLGYSVEEMAEKYDCTPNYYLHMEQGHIVLSSKLAKKFTERLKELKQNL